MRSYFIPLNFAQEGYIYGIRIRNLIETVILAVLIGYPLMRFMPGDAKAHVAVFILVLGPIIIFGIFGIEGMSLTQFAKAFLTFHLRKRILQKPTSKDVIERNKRLLEKQRKRIKEEAKKSKVVAKDERRRKKVEKE